MGLHRWVRHTFYEFAVQRKAEMKSDNFQITQMGFARGIYSTEGLVAWSLENDSQKSQ